ncbi:MAG TPA: hypothetical protein VIT67_15545 [Povalibacter sp.]
MTFSYERRDVGVRLIDITGAHIDVAREADGSISLVRLRNQDGEADATASAALFRMSCFPTPG